MKKSMFVLIISILSNVAIFAQTTWTADPTHSKIGFEVDHLVISEVEGTFKTFEAKLVQKGSSLDNAEIFFEADINSIDTDNEQRDEHLKSEDFFYSEKFPKMSFKSTSFKKVKNNKYKLKGDLTIRGITKAVTLEVIHGGTIENDGYGNTKAGFEISGIIDRTDFGVAWNAKTEHGGLTVGEEVELDIKLEMVKIKSGSSAKL